MTPPISPPLVFPRCIPSELFGSIGLSAQELAKVHHLLMVPRKVKKGAALFRGGQPFKELFAVRSGSFKTSLRSADGRTQVIGLQLPGDFLGIQGIAEQRHPCEALALEDSEVCAMAFEQIEVLARELPPLKRLFHTLMSGELLRESRAIVSLGNAGAEARVACFLLTQLERLKARGFSGFEMVLRLSREDISSYLGLKVETVSRVFSKLVDTGLIKVDNRHVQVLTHDVLAELARLRSPNTPQEMKPRRAARAASGPKRINLE